MLKATLIAWIAIAFLLSFLGTRIVTRVAARFGILDKPRGRRNHKRTVPLLGGVAIFGSMAACIVFLLLFGEGLTGGEVSESHYLGFLLGGLALMVGGYLDDRYELPPHLSILAPIAAALLAIGFGIEVGKVSAPTGGILLIPYWVSNVLVFGWLMVMMYTTKFLDGLDGLATGISTVGAAMIMLLALTTAYFQPDVALLAAVAVGAMLGFFVLNVHPAKIFLGEGGSTFVGYVVGVMAVISGGKVATALLVMGIPLLDLAWTLIRRFSQGGLKRMATGDRKHLHHRLQKLGWGPNRIVAAYLLLAVSFGLIALFAQSRGKTLALAILVALMIGTAAWFVYREKHYG